MQDLEKQDLAKIEVLKSAKNIAILGLSPDESKASNAVAKYLLTQGYNVIPIYPKIPSNGEILGKKAFLSLQEAFSQNAKIDILNIFRKSEALEEVAQEIIVLDNKPKCVWVQLGLSNARAKEMIEGAKIFYEENSCIKIEHKRLLKPNRGSQ